MIDETLLADPHRCPACAALLGAPAGECPACHLPLRGPTAGRLWDVSREVARLLTERARLIGALRAETSVPAYVAERPAFVAPPLAPRPAAAPAAGPQGAEWTPQRVQNLLLALGVGLLGVAAVIFVAVSWGRLGVGGRAAVLSGVTALAYLAGTVAHRRGLSATAEALGLLAVGLALLDCAGARAADLFGLRSVDGLLVAAGTAAVVGALSAAGTLALPSRALRLSAVVLGQLALPFVAVHLAGDSSHPVAILGAAATVQALAALAAVARWSRRSWRDARVAVAAGGLGAALMAVVLAAGAAYGEDGSLVVGCALLVLLAAGAAAAGEAEVVARATDGAADACRGLAALLVVAAAWAPVVDATPDRWRALAMGTTGAVLLAAAALVPVGRRSAPAAVALGAVLVPATAATGDLVLGLAGRTRWVHQPWSSDGGSARQLLDVSGGTGDGPAAWPSILLVALASVTVALAPYVLRAARPAAPASVPLAAAALWLVPAALDLGYPSALGVDIALAAALLLAAVSALGDHRALPALRPMARAGLAAGVAVLLPALTWALAVDAATLVALPVVAALLAVVAMLSARNPELRITGTASGVAAGILLVAESGALTRHGGAGWPSVWSVALGSLAGLAAASAVAVALRSPSAPYWVAVRRALAMAAAAAAVLEAAALCWWREVAPAGAALGAVAVASLLVAASTLPLPPRLVEATDLRLVGGTGCLLAVPLTAADPDRLWVALLLAGVAAAVLGLQDDGRWGWLSGVLLTASSWVRLADAHVATPEAYTVPPALLLLAAGALRRRRDPQHGSWAAYSPGLLLGMVPSLLRAVTDAGTTRPLLLGLAALAVLAVGVARRLQAPLVVGGGVVSVDAVVQLAPYLVAAYDAVPRWVTIGLAGLLLVGAGATYERRVQDLRRVGRSVSRMG